MVLLEFWLSGTCEGAERRWGSLRRAGLHPVLRSNPRQGEACPKNQRAVCEPRSARRGRGDSERLTVIGHNRVSFVMLLSRPQMMLNALKLWGERRQRGKRSHHYSETHHFLVVRHRHFRFRREVTRTNAHVMSRPLSRCSATASQLRIPSWSNHTVLDSWKKG